MVCREEVVKACMLREDFERWECFLDERVGIWKWDVNSEVGRKGSYTLVSCMKFLKKF